MFAARFGGIGADCVGGLEWQEEYGREVGRDGRGGQRWCGGCIEVLDGGLLENAGQNTASGSCVGSGRQQSGERKQISQRRC